MGGRVEMEDKCEVSKIMARFQEKIRFAEGEWWIQFVMCNAFDSLSRC